jgi:predicted glycoside hydrolase/deacetylase ChbG (UPF0249 family)
MTSGASQRQLIVNADDFGQSAGVTEGILVAHERGIVTSTSLMVRWPGAADAVARASRHPSLSLGLHLDLGEWRSRGGGWETIYEVVDLDNAEAIAREVVSQFEQFEVLCGRPPTHVDSHQHVHTRQAKPMVLDVAKRLGIPVRHFSAATHCGAFYGQTGAGEPLSGLITVPALVATLEHLPEGVSELACHPSTRQDLETMYSAERLVELETLCDPNVRAALVRAGIQLIGFAELKDGT